MNWYKVAQLNKELWQIDARSKEYNEIGIEDLDRMAFGFTEEEVKTMHPDMLQIKWQEDLDNVIYEQQNSGKSPQQWASEINLSEPIDVIYEDGAFKIDDGHHRYYAAKILGSMLNTSLIIKDKPHRTAVVKALREGKEVPLEVLQSYPDLMGGNNELV